MAQPTRWTSWFTLVTEAVAAIAAVASTVVLVGGFVLAWRLLLYKLPWEVVIDQLPPTFLVTVGITEVVAPLLGIVGLYALLALAFWDFPLSPFPAKFSGRPGGAFKVNWFGLVWIFAWVLVGFLILWIVRMSLGGSLEWGQNRPWVALGTGVAGSGISCVVLTRIREMVRAFRQGSHIMLTSVFVGVAFLPLLCYNAISLPFPFAKVCATQTQPEARGWLIGQAGDQLILGSTEDGPDIALRHVVVAPSKDAQVLESDKDQKVFALPACNPPPSPSVTPSTG